MTESVTITYIPLIKGTIKHTRMLLLSLDEIFGFMIAASVLSSPDRISIQLANGSVADITQVHTLPFITGLPAGLPVYEYTATIGTQNIMSYSLELIDGAIQLCVLLGVDPGSIITNIKHRDEYVEIDYGKYYGSLSLPNFTEYPDGSSVPLDLLKYILPESLVNSLTNSLQECFPGVNAGIMLPSEVYMICSDKERSNIVASGAATLNIPDSLNEYKMMNPYYIYNVCSIIQVRGQGLAKSIMITMLNDLMSDKKGYNKFLLEVDQTNTVAYNLYISLGFHKLTSIGEDGKTYDLLLLDL